MMMLLSKRLLLSLAVLVVASTNCVHGAKKVDPELSLEAEAAVVVAVAAENSAIMGKIFPLFSKLFIR